MNFPCYSVSGQKWYLCEEQLKLTYDCDSFVLTAILSSLLFAEVMLILAVCFLQLLELFFRNNIFKGFFLQIFIAS